MRVRQIAAYKHLCEIWRRSQEVSGGLPGDETFSRVYPRVPCHYQWSPNVSDTSTGLARIKSLAPDTIHFEQSIVVHEGDLVRNITKMPDGTPAPNYGFVHRVLGESRITVGNERRGLDKRSVLAQRVEKPPTLS